MIFLLLHLEENGFTQASEVIDFFSLIDAGLFFWWYFYILNGSLSIFTDWATPNLCVCSQAAPKQARFVKYL